MKTAIKSIMKQSILFLAILLSAGGRCYAAAGQSRPDQEYSRRRAEQAVREERARFEAIQAERQRQAEEDKLEHERREKLRRQEEQMRAEKARYEALQEERRRQAEQDAQEKQPQAEQEERRERIRREDAKMQAERERFEALQAERRRQSAQANSENQSESAFERKERRERMRREENEMLAEKARFEAIQAERRRQGASGSRRKKDEEHVKPRGRRYGSANSSGSYSQAGPSSSSHGSSDQATNNNAFIRAAGRGDLMSVRHFLSQGAHLDAKDENGSTALHVACGNNYPEVAQHLFMQGANCAVSNNAGRTPLQEAWCRGSRKIIELFTGFFVINDAYGYLIPISKRTPGLLESAHPDRRIDWRQLMCGGYVNVLPAKIDLVAREAARALGVENVYFFQTNKNSSFACEMAFGKIALSATCMADGYAGTYDVNGKPTNQQGAFFKKTLYHELCHIRGRHCVTASQKGVTDTSDFARSQEMEAELGALYYLFKIDGIAQFSLYIDDAQHPPRTDLWRYIAHLYRQLLNNPAADFNIVKELAAHYLEEKTSGRVVIQDIVAATKQQLARLSKRSLGIVDQWVIA